MKTITEFKFIKSTDNVDIKNKSIGIHAINGPDNRGLSVQIKHNGCPMLLKKANDMAEIITRSLNENKSSMKTIELSEAQVKTLINFLAGYCSDYPGDELTDDLGEILKKLEDTQQMRLI